MVNTRNILLFGRTGGGKSALANVLSGKENNFKESENAKSETRKIQTVEFKHNEETYRIVDTAGIGDTILTQSQVLNEIVQGYNIVKNGVHQVLFVVGERPTPEEVNTYNMLKEFFFDDNVDKYITIIRTRFPSFEDEDECGKDIKLLREENNPAITVMLDSNNGFVHVDNPPISIVGSGKRIERQITLNREIRRESRKKLLEHLEGWKESGREDCKPKIWKEIENVKEESKKTIEPESSFTAFIEKISPKCQIL